LAAGDRAGWRPAKQENRIHSLCIDLHASTVLTLKEPLAKQLTTSGATCVSDPEDLPYPGTGTGPEVFASTGGVMVFGTEHDEQFVIDIFCMELVVGRAVREIDLPGLAALAAALPGEIIKQLRPGIHSAELPLGVALTTVRPGLLIFTLDGESIAMPLLQALQLTAELFALVARSVGEHVDQVGAIARV